ncbi:hypothetical protein [Chryseobacterium sp.]|uniref:hypothetical protein n=1 Tax=Chryseobacterium sp. TaxID=1871047 RepID=UPI00289720A8|nr:hypothetical protein [Chryseobacterium sp.]
MALQICPKCKENSFTWFINGKTQLTTWTCFDCDYEAKEIEDEKSTCEKCGEITKTKLKDKEKEYWWCSNCNTISDL